MPALLVTLLIWVLVAGVFFYVLYWAINHVSLPEPFMAIAKLILVILVIIVMLYIFSGILPPLPHR